MVKSRYDVRAEGIGRPLGDGDGGGRGWDWMGGIIHRPDYDIVVVVAVEAVRDLLLPRVVKAFPPLGGGGGGAIPIGTIVVAGYHHGRRHEIIIMRFDIFVPHGDSCWRDDYMVCSELPSYDTQE